MNRSLAEAIGQLIVGKVPGSELDDETKDCLKTGTIGGITIFKENVLSLEQLMKLTDSIRLQSWHPAYIAVDQEGGPVQRLDEILSPLPSMMALGRLNDSQRLKLLIGLAGKQLRLLGFNCVLAPVLDINTNPANPIIGTRAFSESKETVSRLGASVMRSYLEAGVLPVAKHFPGHGDTSIDSHLALPKLDHSIERLEDVELYPFRENLLTTPAILVAHLWVECIDKEELPATLSHNICTKLLKEELGFQNLVVSDDMLMKAITNKWGLEEACVRGIEAGLDLLLVCSGAQDAKAVHKAIMKAVEDGRISQERIMVSCRARQAALKRLPQYEEMERARRLNVLNKSVKASEDMIVDSSASAIELSRGIPKTVFLGDEPIHLYVPELARYPLNYCRWLKTEIPALEDRIVEHRYTVSPAEEECKTLASTCQGNCILVSFRSSNNPGQIRLAHELRQVSKERLLIASDVPYDLDLIQEWDSAVAVFDPTELAVRAFAKLIARQMAKQAGACDACGR